MLGYPQPRLTVAAAIDNYTGYGQLAVHTIRNLAKLTGAFVSVRPLSRSEPFGSKIPHDILQKFVEQPQTEPWEILLHPPCFLPTAGKRTLYFTMWEATKLPPRGVELLNRAEVVVVPNDWNASCFSANGITAHIRKVQLGIDPDVFPYRAITPDRKPICVFGAAGRLAHGGVRKGINEVIECFYRAFPDENDVELWVKGFPDCDISKVRDPRVKVTAAYLTDGQLSDWYSGLDCFVSAARAEGWGLMQHQAMSSGVPVIAAQFSGLAEFFDGDVGYPVDYTLEPASFVYTGCGHWAEPDTGHMIELMRQVYNDRWTAYSKGARASIVAQKFTHENSARQLIKVLEEFKII